MRPLASLALVALLTGAAAPEDTAAAWQAATSDLEATRRGDREAAERCAAAFLALHIALPTEHPRAAESLYRAAQCHAGAGLWGQASALYLRLVERWHGDPLADLALLQLFEGHRAVARYAEAAAFAERYAARNPKDERAPELLLAAFELHRGLGQQVEALAVLDRYARFYDRREPQRAAQVFWRRGELLGPEEQLEHAEAYVARHGQTGPRDLLIVATARVGELRWRAACTKGLLGDLCVQVSYRPAQASEGPRDRAREIRRRRARPPTPRPPAPPTCRDAVTPRILRVHPRDPRRAAEARRWLTAALQLARRDPPPLADDDVGRRRALDAAVAMTAVHLADADLERLLALDPPRDLDFSDDPRRRRVREDSTRRLGDYLARTTALSHALERRYADAYASPSPTARIAAFTRLGQLAEHRADALLLADLPRDVRAAPVVAAFCAAMHEQVAPLRDTAIAAYTRCLDFSTSHGVFTELTRTCEQALHRHDPRAWPVTAELFATSQAPATRPDTIGVVLDPPAPAPAVAEGPPPESQEPGP